jgi:kynureninase
MDTREVESRCRREAARQKGGLKSPVPELFATLTDAALAISQERAARERAEAEAQKWKEVAAREWERARKAEAMLAQARQP